MKHMLYCFRKTNDIQMKLFLLQMTFSISQMLNH